MRKKIYMKDTHPFQFSIEKEKKISMEKRKTRNFHTKGIRHKKKLIKNFSHAQNSDKRPKYIKAFLSFFFSSLQL